MLKSYEANKARFASEVQQSLNKSIEQYFASRARSNIYIMAESTNDSLPENRMRTIVSRIEHADNLMQNDSVQSLILERSSIKRVWSHDTSIRQVEATLDTLRRRPPRQMKLKMDESQTREFEFLTQKLMISISEDLLDSAIVFPSSLGGELTKSRSCSICCKALWVNRLLKLVKI